MLARTDAHLSPDNKINRTIYKYWEMYCHHLLSYCIEQQWSSSKKSLEL